MFYVESLNKNDNPNTTIHRKEFESFISAKTHWLVEISKPGVVWAFLREDDNYNAILSADFRWSSVKV